MNLPTELSKWYAAQASIRRLWAVEDDDGLIVYVTLEPTSDGADPLPVWLARNHDWTNDLKTRTRREVQLQLIVSGDFEEPDVNTDAEMIAELSWRDSWTSP
jgi:hypothetical protein